jgi:hypothetical protein
MTNKSFKQRLAALEALEQESIGRYLPPERYEVVRLLLANTLIYDFGTGAPEGRFAVHASTYPDNPQFRALRVKQCADLGFELTYADLWALCAWLNEQAPGELASNLVPTEAQADALTDDEVLTEAWYGLRAEPGYTAALSASGGGFRPTSNHARRYWERVAERAQALCTERGIILFPLTDEEIRAAIDLIDRDVFTVRPIWEDGRGNHGWRSHHTTISYPYAESEQWREPHCQLATALDQMVAQRGDPPLETKADILAALRGALGES